jgi:RNA-binding protein YhbY
VLRELEAALDHHELVRVRARDRGERDAWIDALARETGAIGLSSIGNVAVPYRPRPAPGDRVRRSPP